MDPSYDWEYGEFISEFTLTLIALSAQDLGLLAFGFLPKATTSCFMELK